MKNNIRQYSRFHSSRSNFNKLHSTLVELGPEPYVMPFWQGVNEKVIKSFKPTPKWGFLSNRALKDTMFVLGDSHWLNEQIKYLKKRVKNYSDIVAEDSVGKPSLLPPPNEKTSHNTIHHLYHQEFFFDRAGIKASKISSVVEWGGGYGNFAKIWMRRFQKSDTVTYTIIDTSLFCTIQWLYLTSIFGKNTVNLLSSKDDRIIKGKINLVPLALLDHVKIKGDLFVSTWGLSESAKEAQDYVVKQDWFGAKHLLIGFQDSYTDLPYAERLGTLAKKDGAKIYDIAFIPNNHYAIK